MKVAQNVKDESEAVYLTKQPRRPTQSRRRPECSDTTQSKTNKKTTKLPMRPIHKNERRRDVAAVLDQSSKENATMLPRRAMFGNKRRILKKLSRRMKKTVAFALGFARGCLRR